MVGTMNGSDACNPTCGGVLNPDEPMTAAGLPPISTVGTVPTVSGAENGSGGDGAGAPRAAGIWWIGHMPVMRSPVTMTGVPISSPQFRLIVAPLTVTGPLPSTATVAPF